MSPLRDRLFWLAIAAGPLSWLMLWQLASPSHFRPAWPLGEPLPLALAVLVYPPLEEIVFRGWLQAALAERFRPSPGKFGISHANLATSGIFALLHLIQHSPLHAMGVLVPSLLFGLFFERHRSLSGPILLHGWYNLGYVYLFGN